MDTKTLIWLAVGAGTLSILSGCEPSKERQAVDAYYRGIDHAAKDELDKAIADYTEAIRLNPKMVGAYCNRGIAYDDKGEFDKAVVDYNEALRLSPRLAGLYNNRGYTYFQMRDYSRAVADCSKAIELDSTFALAYNNRGIALAAQERYDEAIADCGQAIRFDPSDSRPFANRGNAFLEKRLHDKALADLNEALRLNPRDAWALGGRADARLHRGEYQDALADANQALRLDPTREPPHPLKFVAAASAELKKLGERRSACHDPATARTPTNAREPREEDAEPTPPSPSRVAARAIVLSAIVYRSYLDHYADNPEADLLRRQLLDWLDVAGISPELEESEREFLATALGQTEPQALIDGSWRAEGLAVLGWALKRCDLPPHDEKVTDYLATTDAVGFLDDDATKRLLASAELRPLSEIRTFANQITLVSWRLTNVRIGQEGGEYADLREFPAYCVIEGWLKGVRLVNGDLAVGGKSLSATSDAERQTCNSIARERHLAAYWLRGDDETYSVISADTAIFSAAMFESQRGDPDVAARVCTKFLELGTETQNWLVCRGWAHLRKGDLTKALADFNRAVQLQPNAWGHGSRGWAFFHSGDLASAEADADKALSLDPKDTRPHLLLFRIRAARGDRARAIEEVRRLLTTLPTNADAQPVRLVLRCFLGEVPLDTLRHHPDWYNFEVAVRGYDPSQPEPRAPGSDV